MLTSSTETVLEVRHLTKIFSRPRTSLFRHPEQQVAVYDVSFSLPKGSVVGLIGETGSGKTTLGRMVMRLIDPTSGSIHFEGVDLTRLHGKPLRVLRKRFQMVFQDPYSSLNPRMTVRQTIEEPFLVHGVLPDKNARRKALEALLLKVGLDPADLDRLPGEFSGGGRQRIGIARAIALSPNFLVADEPVSSLDVSIQAQIVNLFAKLNKEDNMTFLFISHDLNVVSYLSDYVLVLYRGLNVESGPAQEVFNHPLHPYTRLLVSSASPNDRSAESPSSDTSAGTGQSPPLCPFYDRCPERVEACQNEPPPYRISEKNESPVMRTPWTHAVSCHSPLGKTVPPKNDHLI